MTEGDSKDGRGKAKDALLQWVKKKTAGYVYKIVSNDLLENVHSHSLNTDLDVIHLQNFFGEIFMPFIA